VDIVTIPSDVGEPVARGAVELREVAGVEPVFNLRRGGVEGWEGAEEGCLVVGVVVVVVVVHGSGEGWC